MNAAVLFDLDGTLVDLPVDIEPVRREVLALLAAAIDGDVPSQPLLAAIEWAAASVAARGGDQAGCVLRCQARRLLDAAEVAAAARAQAMPGAREAAILLDRRGFRLGIVTDNGRACLAPALAAAGLDPLPWHATTRDELARPKPAPDGIVAAARALCPDGGAIWYAGDMPRDVDAARAARCELGPDYPLRVAAVLGGRGAESALRQAGPDEVVTGLGAFARLLGAR